jgi:hypothetical protein
VVPATNEKDVLAPAETPAPPDPEEDKPDTTDQADADNADDDDEPASQELAPPARKRINKLLKQRREMRQTITELEGPAQIGRELESFAKASNLAGDEIAAVLKIGALYKAGDFAGFYQAVSKAVRNAQEYLGVVLPPDLQGKVKQGQMTEVAAREFARQRFDGQIASAARQEAEAHAARVSYEQAQGNVHRAVSNFELRLAANDPDYKAKQPAVKRMAQAMLFDRGGFIHNDQEAVEITRLAYDEVNKQIRSFQPRPASTPARPNGSTQAPSTRTAPKTIMEAALIGLEQSRRGG